MQAFFVQALRPTLYAVRNIQTPPYFTYSVTRTAALRALYPPLLIYTKSEYKHTYQLLVDLLD